jgi:hypothetical protein
MDRKKEEGEGMKEPTDRERLDWLEQFVRKEHALTLHDKSEVKPFWTLGLAFGGRMKRSLRDAIDEAAGWSRGRERGRT